MKILQILTELNPGGAERVVLDISRGLVERGHTVSLAVLKGRPTQAHLENEFRKTGIVPRYVRMGSPLDAFRIFRLRNIIRSAAPDVIHAHLMHPNLLSRIASLGMGIPLVNTVHISERRDGQKLFFLLDGMTSGLCDVMTAVSDASARFHEKAANLRENSIRRIYNGVDRIERLSDEKRDGLRMRWQVNMCSKVIGCVGRLVGQKGFDLFVRMLPELSKRVPVGEKWGVVILGEGVERRTLETMAQEEPIPNLIFRMPGYFPDASQMADAFDALVMPSRYEGYGLVLAEAMSLGLPVVVSPADSLPELIKGYPAAFTADFADSSQDASTAVTVMQAAETLRTEPHVICTVDGMVDNYLAAYSDALAHRGK